ncbi:MAG: acyltransferase [Alistipes sp.]
MSKINIKAVLAAKAPRLMRYLPDFVLQWLRKTLHENDINYILEAYQDLPPQEFLQACFRFWKVTYSIEGLDKLDPKGRYLFVSNHPFGGMDGMMLADKLIDYFGDARVVVNDLLMHLDPLRPLWIPVNKHGVQRTAYATRFAAEFAADLPILTFPAGLCSRRIKGVVTDLPWQSNFLRKAYASQREIVPVFVEGQLSNFFYRMERLRKLCGVKFGIEMLWLPDEMFSQSGRHFRIVVGKPIATSDLQAQGSLAGQTEYIRKKTYFLQKMLPADSETH